MILVGRKSDYETLMNKQKKEKQKSTEKEKAILANAWEKLGRESLSAAEMAILVSDVEATLFGKTGGIPYDEKTIKKRFQRICNKNKDLLDAKNFKDSRTLLGKYQFSPEYNPLILSLLVTNYTNGKAEKNSPISWRAELYRELSICVDRLLSEPDKQFIRNHPAYENAELERLLGERLTKELSSALNNLYHVDSIIRFRFMKLLLNDIMEFNRRLIPEAWRIHNEKQRVCPDSDSLDEDVDLIKQIQWTGNLDRLIILLIECRRLGQEPVYITEEELMAYSTFTYASKVFGLTPGTLRNFNIWREFEAEIENKKRYQEIMSGVKNILDLDKPDELQLLEEFESLIKIMYLRTEVSPDEFNRMIRFTEDSLSDEKAAMTQMIKDYDRIEHFRRRKDMQLLFTAAGRVVQ